MRYIDVRWFHESAEDPTRLVSEIAADGFESRKIEYFSGGRLGYADTTQESGGTQLGLVSVPPLEEINADPQFQGIAISSERFEELWRAATSHGA